MTNDEIIAGIQSMVEALGEFDTEDIAHYEKVGDAAIERIKGE